MYMYIYISGEQIIVWFWKWSELKVDKCHGIAFVRREILVSLFFINFLERVDRIGTRLRLPGQV